MRLKLGQSVSCDVKLEQVEKLLAKVKEKVKSKVG